MKYYNTTAIISILALLSTSSLLRAESDDRPNILFISTDQQRFDTIASLGNNEIYTPNLDRLVERGVAMTRAYSESPVCVPARYVMRTGRVPLNTAYFQNVTAHVPEELPQNLEERCGPYLAKVMASHGYRTFGIGKFHTQYPDTDIGYDVYLRGEEFRAPDDAYTEYLKQFPEYEFIEQYHGERTEMYYEPQMSPLPAELTIERWCADRAVEQINVSRGKPYFGFVSFIGPHPPLAPPIPYNRMYDPDQMRDPVFGPKEIDFMDERVKWNLYFVFAEEMSNPEVRKLRARYYGEITYIDNCVGRILDAVEASPDADNTIICFFSDHGEFLYDHRAVQKENFFEESTKIPMLISWPKKLKGNTKSDTLMGLADLFGIATTASGNQELRDGVDILGVIQGEAKPRKYYFGYTSAPGDLNFRMMAIRDEWKYIFHANSGGELLFNLNKDPREHKNLITEEKAIADELRNACLKDLDHPVGRAALNGDWFKVFPRTPLKLERVYQFNESLESRGFPKKPEDALKLKIAQ